MSARRMLAIVVLDAGSISAITDDQTNIHLLLVKSEVTYLFTILSIPSRPVLRCSDLGP